ncbi:hypothetical protein BGZ82_002630 [Podila clonocystis]|nr:hypothetical protein BGZ82_002630 [Podila clonocystis]
MKPTNGISSVGYLGKHNESKIQAMRSILYLTAVLAVIGITLAAPAPAPVEVAEESCWCEPDFRGQRPRKSPDCCY